MLAAAALATLLSGCLGTPDLESSGDPLVVTEGDAPTVIPSPERQAAIAEIRDRARAAGELPYPDAFQSEQTARLAARDEPRSVADIQAIGAELSAIAELREQAVTPGDIAALDARARELRRLAAAAEPPVLRR